MTQKRFVLCVAAGTALAMAGLGFARQIRESVSPFTATVSHSEYSNGSSTPSFTLSETVAARSDGSQVRAKQLTNPEDSAVVYRLVIIDVPLKRRIVVDQLTESLVTYPLGKTLGRYVVQPTSSCAGQSAGEMLGFPVFLEETHKSARNAEISFRKWTSPQLSCFPLREEVRSVTQAGESLNVRSVTSLILGEPANWLFTVPKTYTERSPSQLIAERTRRFPKGFFHGDPSAMAGFDSAYAEAQRRK